jgi:hypothetical protein
MSYFIFLSLSEGVTSEIPIERPGGGVDVHVLAGGQRFAAMGSHLTSVASKITPTEFGPTIQA